MAKFLTSQNGEITEILAPTQSTGAADAGKLFAVDSTGKFDPSLLPTGTGADVLVIVASEALNAGDLVNIYGNNGVGNVRKAIATGPGTKAYGYVIAAVAAGGNASVYFDDANSQVTGLIPGQQFLSASTAGKTVSTAPSGSGQIVQKVGVATSATSMHVNADLNTITLA